MNERKVRVRVPTRQGVFNLDLVEGAKWFARRMPDAHLEADYFGKTQLHQTEAEARAIVDGWAPVEVVQITEDMKA